MMLRIFIHVLFIVFLVKQVSAQKTSDNSLDTKSNSKEFNLSLFTGWSKGGPANDMLSNMNMSSHSASWWGGRSRNYNTKRIFELVCDDFK